MKHKLSVKTLVPKPFIFICRLRRHYGSLDYTEFEESGHRTTVELKSKTSVRDPLIFTKYLVGGFRFQEATIMGPIAIISNGVFGWNVSSHNLCVIFCRLYIFVPVLTFWTFSSHTAGRPDHFFLQ